jgi:phage terminase large subunit-like protein
LPTIPSARLGASRGRTSICSTPRARSSTFPTSNEPREQADLFGPTTILVEDKASGTQLIQDLIDVGLSRVTRYKPDGDKIMRLHAQTAIIDNGFVHLPETAHWLADYLNELTMFPAGRYDDQVDSAAQALAWTKIRPPG